MTEKNELEIVRYATMNYLEVFLVEMTARQPHGHDDLEIGILLEGSATLGLEQTQYELKTGDIYIINRCQMHSFLNTTGKNLILAFQIDTDFYRRINRQLNYLRFDSNVIQTGCLHQTLTEKLFACADCYFSEAEFYEIKCASLLLDTLYFLLENTHYTITGEREYQLAQNMTNRINRITEYISAHHQESISLGQIAAMENITTYHASHFIRRTLGLSFQEYLNNIRFEHALRLLAQTDLNILNICMETGFSSSRYLNQMFEKNLGCTVKEYKKQKQKPVFKEPALPVANIQKRFSRESSAFEFKKRFG